MVQIQSHDFLLDTTTTGRYDYHPSHSLIGFDQLNIFPPYSYYAAIHSITPSFSHAPIKIPFQIEFSLL